MKNKMSRVENGNLVVQSVVSNIVTESDRTTMEIELSYCLLEQTST